MTRAALLVSLLWLAAVPAAAQGLEVAIETPSQLRQGDRTEIVARVMGSDGLPVLVTPSSEGTAVEVVRGRLMRTDATDPAAAVLELRIPIVAREAGTAVLRVRVSGYACEARCRAVSAETSVVIQVASAAARRPGEGKKQARTSSLSWVRLEGAEGCIASAALAQAVEARLARDVFVSAADAGLAVEGRVERDGEIWRAHIEVVDAAGTSLGERSLESAEASCDQLGELATVTIALMIDPLTAPEPAPAPDPEPEPQEDPPPDPEPEVIVQTVEVPVPVEPDPSQGWRFEVDATLVGSVGLVPTPMIGGQSTIILRAPNFVPVAVEGAIFPFSRAETPAGYADFLEVHAGLQICPLWVRENGLALHGCIGADAGAMLVVGGQLEVDEGERLIGQAHAALRGHWDVIGPLTIRAGIHLLVPFRHDAWITRIGGVATQVYSPEPVAGMIDLGVGVHVD